MLVRALLEELTTEALKRRLKECERMLASHGVSTGDRVDFDKQARAIRRVLDERGERHG